MTAMWAVTDSRALIGRSLRHIVRNGEQVVVAVLLPAMILLVFRYMFGGAIDTGSTVYADYLIAGMLVLSVSMNSTATATAVRADLSEGFVDRLRSMPVLSSAVIIGHVAAAVVRNAISTVVMLGVGMLVGFRPRADLDGWLAVAGLMALYSVAMAFLAAILGMIAKTVEGASGLSVLLVFAPYVSSAFAPADTLPGWLRVVVENQPITLVMDTVRPLLLGLPTTGDGWLAVAWWTGILFAAVPITGLLFRRAAR
ncbi:ABC transporter permease [Amycolatopsis sp. YIM 10]|uniref:ABC transporter permease n=1 Tax=Amycolatopsis sp. YIM 10 TaxID=2653857 RepID=UPI0012905A43|nr:ABC transporter permease [Amycolatopsis sp. YIM 10]QFU92386.1 Daunorubicin/doxorubicin resistance ABC transporter permease protein DrrB [Amycolatopsis sp. YIM 10]